MAGDIAQLCNHSRGLAGVLNNWNSRFFVFLQVPVLSKDQMLGIVVAKEQPEMEEKKQEPGNLPREIHQKGWHSAIIRLPQANYSPCPQRRL